MPEQKTEKREVPLREGAFYRPTSPGEKSYLIGSKCRNCGWVAFPKKVVCPACVRDDTMEEMRLSGRGRIESFAMARVAPTGFKAPYIQAFVDLVEGPRVFTLITGVEPTENAVHEGQEVELAIEKISTDERGNDVIGWKFRPLR